MNNKLFSNKYISIFAFIVLSLVLFLVIRLVVTRQETRQQASQTTKLFFAPSTTQANPLQVNPNDTFTLELKVDPGQALVTILRFAVVYDQTKLSVSGPGAVDVNSAVFPVIYEGPFVSPGIIHGTVGIGSDPTQAVSIPSTVATITFKALTDSGGVITVSHDPQTLALSAGASESARENALQSTEPAYIKIGSGGIVSPTISAGAKTKFELTVLLHGIGSSGDNPNPNASSLSNKNPIHKTREVSVELFNSNNELKASSIGMIQYASASGNFLGSVEFGTPIKNEGYIIKIKSDQYLRNAYPGIFTTTGANKYTLPAISLVTGDTNNDNKLNILDYNILYGCYKTDLFPVPRSCSNIQSVMADLNDEGNVNTYDLNLFIRELSVQSGL